MLTLLQSHGKNKSRKIVVSDINPNQNLCCLEGIKIDGKLIRCMGGFLPQKPYLLFSNFIKQNVISC